MLALRRPCAQPREALAEQLLRAADRDCADAHAVGARQQAHQAVRKDLSIDANATPRGTLLSTHGIGTVVRQNASKHLRWEADHRRDVSRCLSRHHTICIQYVYNM